MLWGNQCAGFKVMLCLNHVADEDAKNGVTPRAFGNWNGATVIWWHSCLSLHITSSNSLSALFSSCGRSLPGALSHPADIDRHPAVLPGARGGTADPKGQHWSVELCQPSAGWHRLRQLCGTSDTVPTIRFYIEPFVIKEEVRAGTLNSKRYKDQNVFSNQKKCRRYFHHWHLPKPLFV